VGLGGTLAYAKAAASRRTPKGGAGLQAGAVRSTVAVYPEMDTEDPVKCAVLFYHPSQPSANSVLRWSAN
jgi:hypothetical protein